MYCYEIEINMSANIELKNCSVLRKVASDLVYFSVTIIITAITI